MIQKINDFVAEVAKTNPNEPEFLQAVHEVAEAVIPFIENNNKYNNKMCVKRHAQLLTSCLKAVGTSAFFVALR